ncbi:MAG: transporter [Haloplasmataceae bacterium]|nr:transporter [Haloplasmataceae bacterium]
MSENKKEQNQGGHQGGPRMGMPVKKAKDFKGTSKRLIKYLSPYKYSFIIVFITAILSTLFTIIGPKIMGLATTQLFKDIKPRIFDQYARVSINFSYIRNILLLLALFYIISSLFSYIQQYIMAGISQKTVRKMRNDVNNKLAKLPLKYFDSRTHGEILSRVTNDIDMISNTLQQSVTQLITGLVTIIGVLIIMSIISPILTLVALFTLPLSAIITVSIAKKSQKFFKEQQKTIGDLNGHVEEMFTGHKIIKAYGREESSITKFNEINNKLYKVGWKAQFISGIIFPLLNFISNLGYVVICVIGGKMVIENKIKIGDIQAFINYSRQFTQPIGQIANITNIIQGMVAASERVFEILDEKEEIQDTKDALVIDHTIGNVRFEHVNFSYKQDTPLIEDMNIDVKTGQTIAIVGPTGAGKTTLVNLLMRFYEINDGKITIDDIEISKLKRNNLRSIFGMVLQDTWLFNGTIRDNIAYGREFANEEEIIHAAKAANADHFIRTLPDGYDTVLNEEASNISQGQRQLLTIARAILANPAILILDEATSNVDTRTEVHIQKAMNELMKGRTSFVIAHRLSTIKNADNILVMNNGTVIEQGNHQELLDKNGFYADLYNSQFTTKNVLA